LFSLARNEAERLAARAANRKTPRWPSHVGRNAAKRVGAKRKRPPAERYNRTSYLNAVVRACDRAFPPAGKLARGEKEPVAKWWARLTPEQRDAVKAWRKARRWFPYQLRHTYATNVRREFGLEAAQVLLGHAKANVTQIYAERDGRLVS